MPLLILDTSTERGFVAILDNKKLLYHVELPFGLQNAESLLPSIEQGLSSLNININKIDCIGVGIGPGSYTGIRAGATVAKTLAFACNTPLVGVSSLDGFIPQEEGPFAAVIDAKVGGVYLQTGLFLNGIPTQLSGPQLHPLDQSVEILKTIPCLVTPNANQLRPKLENQAGNNQWLWEEKYPSPLIMGLITEEKFDRQEFSLDGDLELLYLRKTQAEIEKEKMRS